VSLFDVNSYSRVDDSKLELLKQKITKNLIKVRESSMHEDLMNSKQLLANVANKKAK